jgi:hypothetical protein
VHTSTRALKPPSWWSPYYARVADAGITKP